MVLSRGRVGMSSRGEPIGSSSGSEEFMVVVMAG